MRIGIDGSRAFVDKPTGTERYAYEIISRMLKLVEAKEHEFVVYTRIGARIPNLGIKVTEIPMKYLWTQTGLAVRTWTDRLDVLWIPAHTLPVLRKPGLKTVVTIHGIEYEWLPAYENPLQRWYLPWSTIYAVKRASRLITVSKFTKNEIMRRWGADAGKIEVVWEGTIGAKGLGSRGQGAKKILSKYNLLSKKYLLFVGTVQPRKNLVRLIEAFAGLRKRDLRLVISGKLGWQYEEIATAPKKYGVADRVVFTEYISEADKNVLLGEALMYVQPSITEGFGLPVLEAMAAGVPVVSSMGGALAEVVGEAGLLFEPEIVESIRDKIDRLIDDPGLRKQLVEQGRRRVKEFSWDKAAERTLGILTEREFWQAGMY